MGICYIVGAGHFENVKINPSSGDYIIAADKGFSYLREIMVKPNIVIGDFDSLDTIPENENVVQHPIEKDDTDMMLAIKTGLDLGYKTFLIYGGLGGRLDHTYANIQILVYLSVKGARGYLLDGDRIVTAITNEQLLFSTEKKGVISVLSNVAPQQTHDICAKFAEGKIEEARQLQFNALELVDALFCEVNPVPVKHALNLQGWDMGPLRMPLCEMEDANLERLRNAMIQYGILEK